MKKLLLMLVAAFQLTGCVSTKGQKMEVEDLTGIYERQESTEKIELRPDGTYTLFNPEILFTPIIEQCDYASKGKWSVIAENVIEITSEDNYLRQKGFEYDLKKENKLSQDSLYIQIVFPADFHPVKLGFTFNHNNSKSITTDEIYIALPKSKYLWNRRAGINHISFRLNADVSGTKLYKGRVLFKIFDEDIDTEKFNFLTITLPYFNRCFFEFEPYYQELILIKDKNRLQWQGEVWKKQ